MCGSTLTTMGGRHVCEVFPETGMAQQTYSDAHSASPRFH